MESSQSRMIDPAPAAALDTDTDGATAGPIPDFAGDYRFYASESGTFLDFEGLCLGTDGEYTARVEATLVNPGVRSFGAACMLPEHGSWSAYRVSGQTRIRIRPTTSRARVYGASLEDGKLVLSRRGATTTMFEDVVTVRPSATAPVSESSGDIGGSELDALRSA